PKLKILYKALSSEAYPLDHKETSLTVARYLLKELPPDDDLGALLDAVSSFVENYALLNIRLTGRLTTAAERVEAVLKLPPLNGPAKTTSTATSTATPA